MSSRVPPIIVAQPGWTVVARFPDGIVEHAPVAAWLQTERERLAPLVCGRDGLAAVVIPAAEAFRGAALELRAPPSRPWFSLDR